MFGITAEHVAENGHYVLTCMHLNVRDRVFIPQSQFQDIKLCSLFWADYVSIEEKYDTVAENYASLEIEIATISIRNMLFSTERDTLFQQRADVNRLILNFFSSAYMFMEQSRRHILAIGGRKSDLVTQYEALKGSERNRSLGFRAMELLRNFAQHAGSAVDNFSVGAAWKKVDDEELNLFDVVLQFDATSFMTDSRNTKVDDALKDYILGTGVQTILRDAMESLSAVNEGVRNLLAELRSQHRTTAEISTFEFVKFLEGYSDVVGLAAIELNNNADILQHYYIPNAIIARSERFISKNRHLLNLRKRRVMN